MEQQQISYEKVPARAPSKQMQCVIMVLTADAELARVSASHVDCHNETIHWQGIFKSYLSPGLKAAALLAYALWTDEMKPKSNFFDLALGMENDLKVACLTALGMRWGINFSSDIDEKRGLQ